MSSLNFWLMIWQDSDPKKPISQILDEAIEHFQDKYKMNPTHCVFNKIPAGIDLGDIKIEAAPFVLRSNIWIGNENATKKPEIEN